VTALSSDADAKVPVRQSATVVVVRDAAEGIEVLLLRRAERGDRASGAWVFPGGVVEPQDAGAYACSTALDDAEASSQLGVSARGLDYYVCAVRECFEESGLLYARAAHGDLVSADDDPARVLSSWRALLHRGERSINELCREFALELALDRLVYLSHWVTPIGQPKRFDTRFFVAEAPPAQASAHDALELVEHVWLPPANATELKLLHPTRVTLQTLSRFDRVATLLAWARSQRTIPRIEPRLGSGGQGQRFVMPIEPAWAEIGKIDPEGRGHARYEIRPGEPVQLSARVVRVTADNGGMMTGPGTNTYLVGSPAADAWAVVDPGPANPAHIERILAAAPGTIRSIFVTHTHVDHSPAVALLAARTGATVYGRMADYPSGQDATFAPQVVLNGGERIALAPDTTLRVIHTPGHASNHLCYLLEEEASLFTGDHVMQGSTVVISPPDGDMSAYLTSLRALLAQPLQWLLPGHGFAIADPHAQLRYIIAHRLEREARVLRAVRELSQPAPATPEQLLPSVYADVDPRLHPVALRSLRAHLQKLAQDGVVLEREGGFTPR